MRWMSETGSDECEKILYLQTLPGQPFKPYTDFPHLKAEDHFLPKVDGSGFEIAGSKGYATMQKLLKTGWKLVKS
jgi:hypothetical protein